MGGRRRYREIKNTGCIRNTPFAVKSYKLIWFLRITIQFTGNIKSKGFLDNQEELT